jgi:4-amino-4-deoxy-L-arabinose transferase-like glycosyltransferase
LDPRGLPSWRRISLLLVAMLAVAAVERLYQFRGPLLDRLYVKQVYVAHLARNIARPTWNPMRCRFDFLDARGEQMELYEEVPLYAALVGASYRLFGEHEWLGRIVNLLATLVAIVGLYDLVRQEYDATTGLAAAFLLAMSPLSIFYGRAVLPDPCMMASMIFCAASFRRYLVRWLIVSALFGLLAGAFKYYGLFIVGPLADMAYRRGGWRYWCRPRFLVLLAAIVLPVALWLLAVFARGPNPTSRTKYFVWQEPSALLSLRLYDRLTYGLLVKDCGPVAAVLIILGAIAAISGKDRSRPLWGWSATGFVFWLVFAPKMLEHDYYELVFLPVLAAWGALGLRGLLRFTSAWPRARAWVASFTLSAAAIFHSPLVASTKYDLELGHLVVAERLKEVCPIGSRVIVMGQGFGWPQIHYSGRQGWVERWEALPANWPATIANYHVLGAEYVVVYFDPTVPPAARASYTPLLKSATIIEHRAGPWFPGGRPCEYYLLSLRDGPPAPAASVAGAPRELR